MSPLVTSSSAYGHYGGETVPMTDADGGSLRE